MVEEEVRPTEPDDVEGDEDPKVDDHDLTQLPGVTDALEARLKAQGYATLWEVAYEDATILAWTAGVTRGVSEKIIASAATLLGLEADETDESEDTAE